jgi:molybdopterin synthase catalytic subunit
MVSLTDQPIDTASLLAQLHSPQAGAVVMFLGTARQFTRGRETAALDYECYADMARRKLHELEAEARRRWPLVECAVVHRVGRVELGEPSVAVAVSTPHRGEAFEAGRWLIDTLKETVPIWKREQWADGSTEWVHPGVEPSDGNRSVPAAAERASGARHAPAVGGGP